MFGHKDARSKICFMNAKSVAERKFAEDIIFKECVLQEVGKMTSLGTYNS